MTATPETIDHGARAHHRNSPSTLDNKEACPHFKQDDTDNEASKRGTAQHEAMETGDDRDLSDEEYRAVEWCREKYRQIRRGFGDQPFIEINEYRVSVDDIDTTAGFFDKAFVLPDLLDVCDTKFGKWKVRSAKENLQGISYRLGLLRELSVNPLLLRRVRRRFDDPTWTPDRIKRLRVHFLLPYRNEVDEDTCSVELVPEHLLRIRTVTARADNPPPGSENPNTFTCLFCNRKANCRKLGELALKVGEKYEALQVPDFPIEPMLIADLPPEQVTKGLKFFGILSGLCAAWRQQATLRAQTEEDYKLPGYRIVMSEKREIVDTKKFIGVLQAKTGKTIEELVEAAGDFYLTKAEKLVSATAERGQKGAAVESFAVELESSGAVERKPPTYALKQASSSSDD